MRIFELFAEMLDYPAAQFDSRLGDFISALGEISQNGLLMQESRIQVKDLIEQFRCSCEGIGLPRLEEIYSATFDLRADCSLYVGYHLFGDDWRRSSYMVQLQQRYRSMNFTTGAELPDHITTMLRFLGRPGVLDSAGEIVGESLIPAVSQILSRLKGVENPYQSIMEALLICLCAVHVPDEAAAPARCEQTKFAL